MSSRVSINGEMWLVDDQVADLVRRLVEHKDELAQPVGRNISIDWKPGTKPGIRCTQPW